MAVWKRKLAGHEVKIHDVDHCPPHCHAFIDGRDTQIDLHLLIVLKPPPHELPSNLRKSLRKVQEELLEAWERVTILPPGKR